VSRYGLMGKNISYTLSPYIHNEIYKKINTDDVYDILDIDKIDENQLLEEIKNNYNGVNITIPYKRRMVDIVDEISDEAKKISAINTIHVKNGKLIGYNTDYFGFKYMMKDLHINVENKDIVMMGSGGAAASVLTFLLDSSAKKITILTRNKIKTENVIFSNIFFNKCRNIIEVVDYSQLNDDIKNDRYMLINTTPVGMTGHIDELLIEEKELMKFKICIDLIYSPLHTLLLKRFKALKGKDAIAENGIKMLVFQAISAENIWQNIDISYEITDDIIRKLIKK